MAKTGGKRRSQRVYEEQACRIDREPTINRVFETDKQFRFTQRFLRHEAPNWVIWALFWAYTLDMGNLLRAARACD